MTSFEVERTADGYLRINATIAQAFSPSDAVVALIRLHELWLYPLIGPESGGLLLKRRNAYGDRSALVSEVLPTDLTPGRRFAFWDAAQGVLRVTLDHAP